MINHVDCHLANIDLPYRYMPGHNRMHKNIHHTYSFDPPSTATLPAWPLYLSIVKGGIVLRTISRSCSSEAAKDDITRLQTKTDIKDIALKVV